MAYKLYTAGDLEEFATKFDVLAAKMRQLAKAATNTEGVICQLASLDVYLPRLSINIANAITKVEMMGNLGLPEKTTRDIERYESPYGKRTAKIKPTPKTKKKP
jgi:hypothetical protein